MNQKNPYKKRSHANKLIASLLSVFWHLHLPHITHMCVKTVLIFDLFSSLYVKVALSESESVPQLSPRTALSTSHRCPPLGTEVRGSR